MKAEIEKVRKTYGKLKKKLKKKFKKLKKLNLQILQISGQLALAETGLGLSGFQAGGALRLPWGHSLRIHYQNES